MGLLVIAECIHDTPQVGMVLLTCTIVTTLATDVCRFLY